MPTRIEIELTSSSPDGSWTWRAAGAREPRGVLDGSILPGGASVGDQLRVETEHDVDGIRVLSVVPPKEKAARADVLELLPTEESFDPVVQQRAAGGRTDGRGPRRPRRERRDGEEGRADRGDDRRDRSHRGERREGSGRDGREAGDRGRRERSDGERRAPGDDGQPRRHRPHFTPPPELPQRPKPKRLRPGRQHRTDVLGALPEEQRPIAELALQGIAAVRQRLREDNARLKSEGKPQMPEAGVLRMAEELIPRLRVADWLDRADAARRQLEHLDLRDLRSVVASADDPLVARDESTRALAAELKAALASKQEEELSLWLADVEAALDVGRVVRALRLSSVPPKAGVPFPGALATRLAEATTAALQPTDGPDRWSAVLEAAAFSPVRTLVAPTAPAEQRSDELLATVRRLGPLLPQVAVLYGIEVPAGAAVPKPLRPTSRRREPAKRPPPPPEAKRRREPTGPATAEQAAAAAEPVAEEPTSSEPVAAPEEAAATAEPAAAEEPTLSEASAPSAEEPATAADPIASEAITEPDAAAAGDAPTADEPAAADEATASEPPAATVEPAATEESVAEEPVSPEPPAEPEEAPTTAEPVAAEEPTVSEATAPAADEPTASEPPAAAEEPAATEEPVAVQPVSPEPEEAPATADPAAADEPSLSEATAPAAEEPAPTEDPVAEQPVSPEPTGSTTDESSPSEAIAPAGEPVEAAFESMSSPAGDEPVAERATFDES